MWDDILKHLPDFPSAVLSGVDAAGYPFSLRCQPQPDAAGQVLCVQVPKHIDMQPGPASLLCHRHDEQLWNLKSFVVRGTLEQDSQGWILQPRQFIPGAAIGGLWGLVQFGGETHCQTLPGKARPGLAKHRLGFRLIRLIRCHMHRLQLPV